MPATEPKLDLSRNVPRPTVVQLARWLTFAVATRIEADAVRSGTAALVNEVVDKFADVLGPAAQGDITTAALVKLVRKAAQLMNEAGRAARTVDGHPWNDLSRGDQANLLLQLSPRKGLVLTGTSEGSDIGETGRQRLLSAALAAVTSPTLER